MAGGKSRMIRPRSFHTHARLPNVGEVRELIKHLNASIVANFEIVWGHPVLVRDTVA